MSAAETVVTPPVTPPVVTPPVTPPAAGGDWRESLPADLKDIVEKNGFTDIAGVVKAYGNVLPMIGADKIPVPKDGVWDAQAREKLGIPKDVPKDLGGYKVEPPKLPDGVQWDKGFEQAAVPVLHKLGLTPQQVSGLVEFFAGHQVATHKTISDAQSISAADAKAKIEAGISALKGEWGSAFDQKVTFASRAVQHVGGEGLAKLMNEATLSDGTILGDHPELTRAFAKIGELLGEDTLKIGKSGDGALTPAEAKAAADKLMGTEAFMKRDHPEHEATVRKVNEFFAMRFDNKTDVRRGAIVGN